MDQGDFKKQRIQSSSETMSDEKEALSGVPKRTVLASILFIIRISNIKKKGQRKYTTVFYR